MKSKLPAVVVLMLALFCARAEAARPYDWSSCASDLDDVHNESDDAADAAREADEAQEELDSKRNDLESCSDDCEDARSEYEEAKSDLEEKIDNVKNELSMLASNISSASATCGHDLGSVEGTASHTSSTHSSPCSIYLRYKNQLPLATILKTCTGSMSESECKKCLGVGK